VGSFIIYYTLVAFYQTSYFSIVACKLIKVLDITISGKEILQSWLELFNISLCISLSLLLLQVVSKGPITPVPPQFRSVKLLQKLIRLSVCFLLITLILVMAFLLVNIVQWGALWLRGNIGSDVVCILSSSI
jgi:hypothetical protein